MDYTSARQRFASRVRSQRAEKGLTQEQLAELVGKTTEHISFLERAERSPSFEMIVDLLYEGVVLQEIYKLPPTQLEPLFQQWEAKTEATGTPLNNPKIPMRYVKQGERVYPVETASLPEPSRLF